MILADVYVPVLDETFDFQLDEKIGTEILITEMVSILERKFKCSKECDPAAFDLYDADSGELIGKTGTLQDAGIRDGSRLMLI